MPKSKPKEARVVKAGVFLQGVRASRDQSSVPRLKKMLINRKTPVLERVEAAEILSAFNHPSMYSTLRGLSMIEINEQVRYRCILGLAKYGEKKDLKLLYKIATKSSSPYVVFASILGLKYYFGEKGKKIIGIGMKTIEKKAINGGIKVNPFRQETGEEFITDLKNQLELPMPEKFRQI